jgi:hypothetical protein
VQGAPRSVLMAGWFQPDNGVGADKIPWPSLFSCTEIHPRDCAMKTMSQLPITWLVYILWIINKRNKVNK